MTKTFWISFSDPALPEDRQVLGAVVVDLTEAERAALLPAGDDANPDPDVQWFLAALRKSFSIGVNPGGQAMGAELTAKQAAGYPRDRLLTPADVRLLEAKPGVPMIGGAS